jgi:hypothetical protein
VSYATYEAEIAESKERFTRETAHHEMTVLHNDGLYRHLHFRNPKNSTYWFDLITVPHALIFRGDGESYVFSRLQDMFRFFGSGIYKDGSLHINPQYWAEKITSHRQYESYDEEIFKERLMEEVQHHIDPAEYGDVQPDQADRFRKEVQDMLESEMWSTADLAISMLEDFEFWNDEKDEYRFGSERTSKPIRFEDSYEWVGSCTAYDWWYLWACHGIVWGIQQFLAAGHTLPEEEPENDFSRRRRFQGRDVARMGQDVTRQAVVL